VPQKKNSTGVHLERQNSWTDIF